MTLPLLVKELKLMKYLGRFEACHVGLENLKTITEAKLVQMGIPLGAQGFALRSYVNPEFLYKDSLVLRIKVISPMCHNIIRSAYGTSGSQRKTIQENNLLLVVTCNC